MPAVCQTPELRASCSELLGYMLPILDHSTQMLHRHLQAACVSRPALCSGLSQIRLPETRKMGLTRSNGASMHSPELVMVMNLTLARMICLVWVHTVEFASCWTL